MPWVGISAMVIDMPENSTESTFLRPRCDVEYFIDFFLYFHAFEVNDVNRARVAASMEQYPIDAPWRSKELTIFVELTLP